MLNELLIQRLRTDIAARSADFDDIGRCFCTLVSERTGIQVLFPEDKIGRYALASDAGSSFKNFETLGRQIGVHRLRSRFEKLNFEPHHWRAAASCFVDALKTSSRTPLTSELESDWHALIAFAFPEVAAEPPAQRLAA